MKVFVTGVGGQLGHDVMNELAKRGYEGVGSDIKPEYSGVQDGSAVTRAPYVALDITDKESVMETITEINPDVIVHCAAWTAVDAAEDEEKKPLVHKINVEGTQNMADAAKAVALVKDSKDEDHPQIVGFTTTTLDPFTGKYNERVGRSYEETDGIDDLSPYLKKVYGLSSSTTGKIESDPTAEQDRNPGVTEVTYNGKTYKFDGWYYADGVKVSSDYTYANRITANTELTAGYRRIDVDESKGLTVTKNATEKYFADGTSEERVRYVTQVNTYGCSDTDYNIKDIAIIYIKPYNGNSFTDSDIASIVEDVKTNNDVKALLEDTNKRETTVKTISNTDSYKGIAYAYDVVITASDGTKYDADLYDPDSDSNEAITKIRTTQIALTNKNRVQFALDLPLESVQTGNKNADIIVIAAMNYNNEYIASDNYIRYTAGN